MSEEMTLLSVPNWLQCPLAGSIPRTLSMTLFLKFLLSVVWKPCLDPEPTSFLPVEETRRWILLFTSRDGIMCRPIVFVRELTASRGKR